jgi:CheY-like chemotaxis protein
MGAAKLLLIDDNSMARKLSSNFLKKINPHWELIDFSSAKELFIKLETLGPVSEMNPIMIFTDLNMPDVNGADLTSRISQHPTISQYPRCRYARCRYDIGE